METQQIKKYTKYRPSGIDWIGDIPEHWEIKRIRYEIDFVKGKNPKELTFEELGKPYLTMEYLRETSKQVYYVGDYKQYINVNENEILLLWDGSNAGEFIKSKSGVLSSTMALISIHDLIADYTWYYFKSFERILKALTIGMGIPHVNGQELLNLPLLIPPEFEQTAIAQYLDEKTARVDKLVDQKIRLIELLKEERDAVINQAVTRGIDPNVNLKPSGIDWLGEIPEHWEVKKLKHIAKLKSGESITSDNIRETDEFAVFGGNGLRGFTSTYTHDGDYILIGRQGALCGNINYASGKFFASEHAVVVTRLDNENITWLAELLRSMNLNQYSLSAAQPGLSVERLSNLSIPYPNVGEQTLIGSFVFSETKRINALIEKVERKINLLTEYRTVLVSEVVTGKIKVI